MGRLSKIFQNTDPPSTLQEPQVCSANDGDKEYTNSPCLNRQCRGLDESGLENMLSSTSSQSDTISPVQSTRGRHVHNRGKQVFCVEAKHYPVYDSTDPRHNSALRLPVADRVPGTATHARTSDANRHFSWRKSFDSLFRRKSQNYIGNGGYQTSFEPSEKKNRNSFFTNTFSSSRPAPMSSKNRADKEQLSQNAHNSQCMRRRDDGGPVRRKVISYPRAYPRRHPIILNGEVLKNGDPYPKKRLSRQEFNIAQKEDRRCSKGHISCHPEAPASPSQTGEEGEEEEVTPRASQDVDESLDTASPELLQEQEVSSVQYFGDLSHDVSPAEKSPQEVQVQQSHERKATLSSTNLMDLPRLHRFDYPCVA